jgi:nicotinamidase/pyrazinamidase
MQPTTGDVLMVVDVQYDFLEGGALGIASGSSVIAPLNHALDVFIALHLPVVATRDWHPANHCSFHERGGPWPVHCVQGTHGADFHASLRLPADTIVVAKGADPAREAYSGFEGTDLAAILRRLGCRRLWIGGLATDYCVRASGRDALAAGFDVVVIEDGVCAVDVTPGDGARALDEPRQAGARMQSSATLQP